jgi:hypothetical protein
MKLKEARDVAEDVDGIAALIDVPYEDWAGNCHGISYKVLASGAFGPGRIARGRAAGVMSQHSWIVLGNDVYDSRAVIVDPTIRPWLARAGAGGGIEDGARKVLTGILVDEAANLSHRPHGSGQIWNAARPACGNGGIVELTLRKPLSEEAQEFLEMLGPMDIQGWMMLANGPMGGWPAGEIIAAMDDTKELRALIPVDILGHVTDRNPGKLYLAEEE